MTHADLFDRYQHFDSPVHRLDPRMKVIVAVLMILSNVLLPDGAWIAFGISFSLIVLISSISGLGAGFSLRRSFIVIPFVLVAVTAVFAVPGNQIFQINLGQLGLTATDAGLVRFISIVIRSWLSIQVAILLVATTQFPDLMHALRHLKIPSVLVSIISFMYRYLFVLTDETLRLLRARESRSARLMHPDLMGYHVNKTGGTVTWRARIAGNLAGQLFLRSYERSERVYNAMVARGYTGILQTLNPHIITMDDWLLGGGIGLCLLIIQIIARL